MDKKLLTAIGLAVLHGAIVFLQETVLKNKG